QTTPKSPVKGGDFGNMHSNSPANRVQINENRRLWKVFQQPARAVSHSNLLASAKDKPCFALLALSFAGSKEIFIVISVTTLNAIVKT
ncbi:MAG: hypothetical protein ACOY15_14295, partial [Pseudomonadota bacterium]